ncbi:MAG: hypothetical protein RIS85_921 [Pseudomonadota bacterium]
MRLSAIAAMGWAGGVAMAAVAVPAQAADPATDEPSLEFVFEETVTLAADITPGKTPLGGRNIIPITGGHFEGPGIKGTILPGGWDWQLVRPDNCLQIKADYFLKTDDGVVINVVNSGVACAPVDGKPSPVRTHPVFEAPMGKYDWLNRQTFIGTLVPSTDKGPAVRIRFYRVR